MDILDSIADTTTMWLDKIAKHVPQVLALIFLLLVAWLIWNMVKRVPYYARQTLRLTGFTAWRRGKQMEKDQEARIRQVLGDGVWEVLCDLRDKGEIKPHQINRWCQRFGSIGLSDLQPRPNPEKLKAEIRGRLTNGGKKPSKINKAFKRLKPVTV